MANTMNHFTRLKKLGDQSIESFLKNYWQEKPLLIKNAFPNFISPLSGDELAGLSLEDGVTSRLVIEDPNSNDWQVTHGPIEESQFSKLPDTNWSLLVEHVDSLIPEINNLLDAFRFIPNWRLDDIMVSYAPDKGGVGPHFDYYDVFLLQGEGKRRWRLGQKCNSESPLVPFQPMRLLQEFECYEEYVVEPGDLLYVPAKTAHWGEAIGNSITYSIGFRAPSHAEILLDYSEELASFFTEDKRYFDKHQENQTCSGEISEAAVSHFKEIITQLVNDESKIKHWLGCYVTQLNYPSEHDTNEFDNQISDDSTLRLSLYSRCAYIKSKPTEHETLATCYINGQEFTCTLEFAKTLSNYAYFLVADYCNSHDSSLITRLNQLNLLESR